MLNWAARYFPIVRVLKQHLNGTDSLLEIGSGSVGVGKFYPAAFVGCDVSSRVQAAAADVAGGRFWSTIAVWRPIFRCRGRLWTCWNMFLRNTEAWSSGRRCA